MRDAIEQPVRDRTSKVHEESMYTAENNYRVWKTKGRVFIVHERWWLDLSRDSKCRVYYVARSRHKRLSSQPGSYRGNWKSIRPYAVWERLIGYQAQMACRAWSASGSSAMSGHSVGGPSATMTGSWKSAVEHLKLEFYATPSRSSPSRSCRTAVAVPRSVISTQFAVYSDFLSFSRSASSS